MCFKPKSQKTVPGQVIGVAGLTVNIGNREPHVRDHGAAVSPHSPSWDDGHGYFQGSPAVRGHGQRGRGRSRNRVVIVRNGCFTWTRKDGEKARDPCDEGSHSGNGGGYEEEKKKKEGEREERGEVISLNAGSGGVTSPVEWTLSDLNFTIYSVKVV